MACKHDRTDVAGWPFQVPDETRVYASVRILREGLPIVLVSHDADGDWQFACGSTDEAIHAVIACLGCLVEADPTLAALADLPPGTLAWRLDASDPWTRGPTDTDGF